MAVTREGQGVVVLLQTGKEEEGDGNRGGGSGEESREREVVVDEQGWEEVNQGWKSRAQRERGREGATG